MVYVQHTAGAQKKSSYLSTALPKQAVDDYSLSQRGVGEVSVRQACFQRLFLLWNTSAMAGGAQ